MPVSAQETVFHHVGNGVTVTFAYNCQVLLASDLFVFVNDAPTTSGFTVNGIGTLTGGTVTFDIAPANGASVRIERDVDLARTTDYQQNGDFLARIVNLDFNRIWMALQQAVGGVNRALRIPKSDTNPITELPPAAQRADKLLSFDSAGNPITVAPAEQSASALSIALAAFTGSTLVTYLLNAVNAVARSLQDKSSERVSVFDFMTLAQKIDVRLGLALLDHTAPFQAFLDHLNLVQVEKLEDSEYRTLSAPRGYVNFGRYRVTQLQAYDSLDIEGERATIFGSDPTKDIFTSSTLRWASIKGISLVGGKSKFNCGNTNYDACRWVIDECEFHGGSYYPLVTTVYGGIWTHLSTTWLIKNSKFMHTFGFALNRCDYMIFRNCDFYPDRDNFADNMAGFVNPASTGNCRLYFYECTGVPTMGEPGVNRRPGVRWIDHKGGDVFLDKFRGGGEAAGIPLIYFDAPPSTNGSIGPQISIENSELSVGPNSEPDSCVIYLVNQVPQLVNIDNCKGANTVPIISDASGGVNWATYWTNWEAATGVLQLRYFNHFKMHIGIVGQVSPDFTTDRVPEAMATLSRSRMTIATRSTSQVIPVGTTPLEMDGISFDNLGAWVPAQPSRLTQVQRVRRGTLTAACTLAPGIAQGVVALRIYNSSGVIQAGHTVRIDLASGTGGNITELNVSIPVYSPLDSEYYNSRLYCTSVGGCTVQAGTLRFSFSAADAIG